MQFAFGRTLLKAGFLVAYVQFATAVVAIAQQSRASLTATEAMDRLRRMTKEWSAQEFFAGATYVGSKNCTGCHDDKHAEWSMTWHSKMLRHPSPDVVLGNFNNQVITFENVKAKSKDGKEGTVNFKVRTGHADGRYFFTVIDLDDEKNNQTFDVGLVIGGKWDQHYHVKVGDNYLPAPIRWSVAAGAWHHNTSYRPYDWIWADFRKTGHGLPRKPDELPSNRFAEAKCMGCHTTGFQFEKDKATNLWKMQGNGELGIGCERCHGPGSKHIAQVNAAWDAQRPVGATTIIHGLKDMTPIQQTQICAQCHGRNAHKEIPDLAFQGPLPSVEGDRGFLPGDTNITDRSRFWSYSGATNMDEAHYFWKNDWAKRSRQQWQDFTKSTHFTSAGLSCLTCHTFHGKWQDAQLRQSSEELCGGCHSAVGRAKRPNQEMFSGSLMERAGVQCIDCHMPRIGTRSEETEKGPPPWDVSSHTFMVSLPKLQKTHGVRSACMACHEGGPTGGRTMPNGQRAPVFTVNDLDEEINQTQIEIREKLGAALRRVAAVPDPKGAALVLLDQARYKLSYLMLDGSDGVHNKYKARNLLREVNDIVDEVCRKQPPESACRE